MPGDSVLAVCRSSPSDRLCILVPLKHRCVPRCASAAEKALLTAERIAPTEWLVKTATGDTHLRPFTAMQDQLYHTYTDLL